jgi:hypothetical protein
LALSIEIVSGSKLSRTFNSPHLTPETLESRILAVGAPQSVRTSEPSSGTLLASVARTGSTSKRIVCGLIEVICASTGIWTFEAFAPPSIALGMAVATDAATIVFTA